MGEIVLARIDDRLIHGQVMTAWLQFTGGNHIVIVDDATAGDEFTKSIMSMAVPNGIKLSWQMERNFWRIFLTDTRSLCWRRSLKRIGS